MPTFQDSAGFVFGPGSAWGVVNTFIDGTTPAIAQPVKFDVMQSFDLALDATVKRLMGSNIFPRAIGISEGKVTCKIKVAKFGGNIWQLRLGEPAGVTTGQSLMEDDFAATIPGTTPFTITVTPPNSGTWLKDWGVRYSDTDAPLTAVSAVTAAGQYSVAAGVYTFDTADSSRPVVISYEYTVTTGNTLTMLSHPQGQVALTSLRYQGYYGGRLVGCYIPNAVGSTLSIPSKQGDFAVPEMDFEAFADTTGKVAVLYLPTA